MDTQPSVFYYILSFSSSVLTDIMAEDDLQRKHFCATMTTSSPCHAAVKMPRKLMRFTDVAINTNETVTAA